MRRLVLLILLLFSNSAFSEELKSNPIDVSLKADLDKEVSTGGMVRATNEAGDKWNKKLNSLYSSLKKQMTSEEWASLEIAQKAWTNYRDLQIKSLQITYSQMDGSMWRPVFASDVMEITKQRALFLESLLVTVSER